MSGGTRTLKPCSHLPLPGVTNDNPSSATPSPPRVPAHRAGLRLRCLGGSPAPPVHLPLGLHHDGLQVRLLLQRALELRLHHGYLVPQVLVHGHEALQLLLELESPRQPQVSHNNTARPPPGPPAPARRGKGICPGRLVTPAPGRGQGSRSRGPSRPPAPPRSPPPCLGSCRRSRGLGHGSRPAACPPPPSAAASPLVPSSPCCLRPDPGEWP